MRKVRITEATLKGLKAPSAGKRSYVWDAILPGFGVMTMDTGSASFIVYCRFGGSRSPSRRKIGTVGRVGLAEARALAREQLEAAHQGRDPKAEKRAERIAEESRKTFGDLAEIFIARHVRRQRKGKDVEREIRNELLPKLGDRPIEEITRKEIAALIGAIRDRPAPRHAHNIFGHLRRFYSWLLEQPEFEDLLEASPCDRLRAKALIGEKRIRTRVLDDAEIAAIWKAAEATLYPYGDFIQLVMLTGARKSEASEAAWSELDLDAGIWTVPEERFKSGVAHRVPLSKDAIALLRELPRRGDFLFSFDGEAPLNSHSKLKRRLDALVIERLGREVDWQIHDLRRTVRTRLAGLGISDTVAEMVIGHAPRGLARVYNQHAYEEEMRKALDRWAARLRSIVERPPENVADFEEGRRARA